MHSLLLLKDGIPDMTFRVDGTQTIGRSSACDIQLMRPELSRQHAQVSIREDSALLMDLGSQNGTFLNGKKVSEEVSLTPGDEIRLGSVGLIFDPPLTARFSPYGDRTLYVVEGDGGGTEVTPQAVTGSPTIEALMRIFELTCDAAGQLEMAALMPRLLDSLVAHFYAERGYLLLGKSPNALQPVAASNFGPNLAVSRRMIERVFSSARPLLLRDALEAVSFVGSRSVLEHHLRSVMVCPIITVDERCIGMIHLDKSEAGAFGPEQLSEFALLAKTCAVTIENAIRYERAQKAATAKAMAGAKQVFVGNHGFVKQMLQVVQKAAASTARILITGESGVGKELVATLIHEGSKRADGPLVAVNCGALPEKTVESALFGHKKGAFTGATETRKGYFALADGGTLFLDEVGELPLEMQVKLLRALQEGCFYPMGSERPVSVDIRVIAATNRDLESGVSAGTFREDLFYRLNVIGIAVPSLRERASDIPMLVEFFLKRFALQMGKPVPTVSDEVSAKLLAYSFPGNVRELQNLAERLVVLGDGGMIQLADLPREILQKRRSGKKMGGFDLKTVMAEVERDMIEAALIETGGKKAAACRLLGISRPTLDKKISELNIEV